MYVRLGSDIKTVKGIIAEDNYRDKFYKWYYLIFILKKIKKK